MLPCTSASLKSPIKSSKKRKAKHTPSPIQKIIKEIGLDITPNSFVKSKTNSPNISPNASKI